MVSIKIPKTTKRVCQSTKAKINSCIREQTLKNLKLYKDSNKALLTERLKELDKEWDTERVLETNAGILILISSYYGLKSKKYFFLTTGIIGFFLLLHGLKGWCPPLPFLRKCMVRTSEEIHNEKMVLKILRGDFIENTKDVDEILKKVEN